MRELEELREYTAMKYAGDCKCGKCQLVPRELVERIYHTLNGSAGHAQTPAVPQEVLRKMHHLASVCCDEDVLRWFDANPATLSDTSTLGNSK